MEKEIGEVIHYFDKIGVGIFKLSGSLKVGDKVKIVGGEREVEMSVDSMQVDRAPIEEAKKGMEIGVKVPSEVKEGDKIYLVTE